MNRPVSRRLAVRITALAALLVVFDARIQAAQLTIVHNFTSSEGSAPSGLSFIGSQLFGATGTGGTSNHGTIFSVNPDATGYTTLHSFAATEGTTTFSPFTLVNSTLYGMRYGDAASYYGLVYSINENGTGYAALHSFAGQNVGDGSRPQGALTAIGSTLYGATLAGGTHGNVGTFFSINADGSAYTSFSFGATQLGLPNSGFTVAGGTLHGTAGEVLYSVNTDFTGLNVDYTFTGNFGPHPTGGVTLVGSKFYGTTQQAGAVPNSSGFGNIYSINPDGSGYTTLHYFSLAEGTIPEGNLVDLGSTLYGTTRSGTVFSMKIDGSDFTVLHNFTAAEGGHSPYLVLAGSTLYGTITGGETGNGAIFAIAVPEPTSITLWVIGLIALVAARCHLSRPSAQSRARP